jgi:hypothetical protein
MQQGALRHSKKLLVEEKKVRGMSVNMMQLAVLTSFNILYWSF